MAATCPVAWCDQKHAGPLPDQRWAVHEGTTDTCPPAHGTRVSVGAFWLERLGGEQVNTPRVVIHITTTTKTTVAHLMPGQAVMLAEAMHLTDDGDRWLANALTNAARTLSDQEAGR